MDWRSELESSGARQRLVNDLVETMKLQYSLLSSELLLQIQISAVTFEQNVFLGATTQSDYFEKISSKLLTVAASADPNNNMVDGTRLHPDSRQGIVNKILETLKRHLPISGPEGLNELKKIAVRFEEKIYTAATSQSDYLRKISLKMLAMETKSQNIGGANSIPQNPVAGNQNPPDPATAELGQANTADWQEEAYQKIKAMKEMYLPDLLEMHKNISLTLEQHETGTPLKTEQIDKRRLMKMYIERIITFLQVSKSNIPFAYKDNLDDYGKQIINFLNSTSKKPVSADQQQIQPSGSHPLSVGFNMSQLQ